jgi:hypothetical protein
VLELGRYHLARCDCRVVAAATRLQVFLDVFDGLSDGSLVGLY